jgi:PAS domain S-box-containing protein
MARNPKVNFLAGGGELAEAIAAFDWSKTPLGPIEGWPATIKTTVALMLRSPVPMVSLWGEPGTMIYNDAYSKFAGTRHPALLGSAVREGWPEVADFNDNIMKVVLGRGETLSYRDFELVLYRSGSAEPEHVWFNLDYSPVLSEDGTPIGVIAIVVVITEAHYAAIELNENQRRLEFLDRLGKETTKTSDADSILAITTRMVGEYLGVTSCAYADMDEDQNGFTVRGDWAAPDARHIVGHYRLADFGKMAVENLGAGKPLVINDSLKELAPEEAATFQNIGISATICMPLVKEGRLTAMMAINHKAPHVWTAGELALIGEVTERSWAHIERAHSEAEIRANRERLELALAAGSGVGIWDWNIETNLVVADERFARLYNVDPELAKAGAPIATFFNALHPDDSARVQAEIAAALKTGKPFDSEYRLVQPDGHVRWVVARGQTTLSPDGRPNRFPGASFDITARRVAEENLRALNADLERQIVERSSERGTTWQVSPHLLSVIDLETGRFARINPAWETTLGWAESDMIGAPFADFLHPEDIEKSHGAFEKVAQGLPVFDFENRYRDKNGTYRWLSWVAVPEGNRLFSTARDITAEKENAAALAAAEESLRQSQKMEAVGQLTGGLAHDFNNLLAGMSGSLELIQSRIKQGRFNDIERYATAAQGAAKRAASLTHRLLAFSRRQTLTPQPTNVNKLISGIEDLIRRTVGPSIALEVVGTSGIWPTFIDPNQLENALLNLCINSRDAMPTGGRITIETANKWIDDAAGRTHEMDPGQYLSVCVTDTGSGMTPDVIAQAFEPFFTTKPIGQGTGLGLSMIYGFVRQSGGQVRIYSEVGTGTTVCLYLPRYYGEVEDTPVPPSASHSPTPAKNQTVLVVDDEPTVRMLITDLLEELGCSAIEAADSIAGLKILQSNVRIDLLVTDVGLPGGMNGRQMADAALAVRPDLQVLFITGYAENAVVGSGQLEPDMHVMTKPFSVEVMTARIRELLSSRTNRQTF